MLNITSGGTVTSNTSTVYIGENSGSQGTVTVNGAGSPAGSTQWMMPSQALYVGYYGAGTLNITNGGAVGHTDGYLGYTSVHRSRGDRGRRRSMWTNSGSLTVGYSGAGTVTQTGGTVSVGEHLYLGYSATGNGTYNLNGGVLAFSGLSGGSGSAAFNFGGGTLRAGAAFSSSLPMTLTGTGGNATVNTQSYAVTLSGIPLRHGGLTKLGAAR